VSISCSGDKDRGRPESTEDRHARLRVSAMGALKWVLGTFHPGDLLQLRANCSTKDAHTPTESIIAPLNSLLSSRNFGRSYNHATPLHFCTPRIYVQKQRRTAPSSQATEGFELDRPIVRRVAWGIVQTLVGGPSGGDGGEGWSGDALSRSPWVFKLIDLMVDRSPHWKGSGQASYPPRPPLCFRRIGSVGQVKHVGPLLIFLTSKCSLAVRHGLILMSFLQRSPGMAT